MERLILDLHHSSNQASSGRIHELQKQIQTLQRDKAAWQTGLDLLHHDEPVMRFYGALTLTIKINADWDLDGLDQHEQMRADLLEALVTNYIRLVALHDSNFVLRKLCSTLITLFARPDSGWTCPILHVFSCLLARRYLHPGQLPRMVDLLDASGHCSDDQLRGGLMLATMMAEDLNNPSSTAEHEAKTLARLGSNCADCWALFEFSIHRLGQDQFGLNECGPATQKPAAHLPAELLQSILAAAPFWVGVLTYQEQHGNDRQAAELEARVKRCLAMMSSYFGHESLTGAVMQMLIALQQSSPRRLREAVEGFPRPITTSRKAQELTDSLIEGEFTVDGVLYVELLESTLSQIDLTSPQYLHDDLYTDAVRTLQKLLRCQGIAVIEDSICQLVLEMISEIVEGYEDWPKEDPARAFLHALTADACNACLQKIKFPLEHLSAATQDWDADDQAKFQDFRYDVQDFFQSAISVLGDDLIEEVGRTVVVETHPFDWSAFEAAMFALSAFSDLMSSNPDTYDVVITSVLNSSPWRHLLQSGDGVPDRVRQTGIKFISDNAVHLQRHADILTTVLNFLFSSLHLRASATAASRAIYALCDSHRAALSKGLPQFIKSLTVLGDVGPADRNRVFAAVAALIQALPSEEKKIEPLSHLVMSVTHTWAQSQTYESESGDHLRNCTGAVQTLSSIGRGLRSPLDQPVNLEHSEHVVSNFWTSGPGAATQRDVLQIYREISHTVLSDSDHSFVDACCDFIKSGFTEGHPSPFKFPDVVGLELVTPLIRLDSTSIDSVMACASSFLASADESQIRPSVEGLLYAIVSILSQIASAYSHTQHLPDTTFLSSALDFLARLMAKWGSIWFAMPDSPETAAVVMELALLVMADIDTLPRRSAATFFAAFADCSGPKSSMDGDAAARARTVLAKYSGSVLTLTLRLVAGGCARSEIESITDILRKFVQNHVMMTRAVLREAIKDTSNVMSDAALQATTPEKRSRFLAQVESLRGGRKTIEVVKDFWITCRGRGFGYVA